VKKVTVNLHFRENPFFEDQVISTSAEYEKDDEQSVAKVVGFPIKWKEGQDLSKKKIKKKQKNKKTGETRTIVKTVDSDSLFNLFSTDREAKKMEKEEEPDTEEEGNMMKIEDLQNFIEDINDIALPDALEYYLNLHEDDMPGMGEDDEDRDDDDQDDEDQDDDDGKKRKKSGVSGKSGEDEEGGKKKKKGGKKGGNDKAQQEECKQQ
jgi:nucleosome assembly protein 1-like 1